MLETKVKTLPSCSRNCPDFNFFPSAHAYKLKISSESYL